MPRRHLKSKLRHDALTGLVRDGLTSGHFFFEEPTPDQERELWARYREVLMEDTIRTCPGTRPSAWWKFEAPGPRERIGGMGDVRGKLCFGVPSELHGITPGDPPRFEAQALYLERHGLLTAAECESLAGQDIPASSDCSGPGVWVCAMSPWEAERQEMSKRFAVRLDPAKGLSGGRVSRRRPARIARPKRAR